MQAFTIENDVLTSIVGPVDPAAVSITVRAPVAPYRAPPAPLSAGQPGVLTIVDRLSLPTLIEIITYAGRTVNGDGSVTLTGVVRGRQGTVARAWVNSSPAYQAPTRDQLQQTELGASLGSVEDAAAARTLIGAGIGNGSVSSVGATAPLQSTGGATPTISMPASTGSNDGHMTAAQAGKLDGIAAGATVYTDELARGQVAAMLVPGSNVSFDLAGAGAAQTLTINSTGGSGGVSFAGPAGRLVFLNGSGGISTSANLSYDTNTDRIVAVGLLNLDQLDFGVFSSDPLQSAGLSLYQQVFAGGIASWQWTVRSGDGLGLIRMRLLSGSAGPEISFGPDSYGPIWHHGNLTPVTGVNTRTGAVTLTDTDVPATIVTEATTSRAMADGDAGRYIRHTSGSAKTATYGTGLTVVGQEFHHRNVGANNLTLTPSSTTLNAPAGGTLVIPPGGTATVKQVGATEFDVFGTTTAA